MSLAEDLQHVLNGVAAVLRSQGVEDVAVMAEQAAGILAGHVAGGDVIVAEDAAVRLIDHLFRGSAAAGAIQSMPPVAEPPAAEADTSVPADEPPAAETAPPVVPDEPPAPVASIDLGTVGEPVPPLGWAPPPDPPAGP